ncbi:MAG: sigma-54-dependent Fis family transcriptional regulator [Phycisphaerae bacterium]|nr:sigma-54-dependent Fis family transcriptional regulator [Phycisphaerae bacterium]
MAAKVLLVSSDPQVRQKVHRACEQLDATLIEASGTTKALSTLESSPPDVLLLDIDQSEGDGFGLFDRLNEQWPRLCSILIAERARSEQAIEAIKRGAIDYLLKPLTHTDLVSRIANAIRVSRDMTVPAVYETEKGEIPADRLIGQSPAMQEVFKLIGLIAPRDVNVLIAGESGTGKELVAKALYHHGNRAGHPFLAVNCAAIPETLLESELFGHEKGSFTGADVRRIGKFEQCDGGVLFLDEIGDLPPATQAKLLRVLQDGRFQRLGGTETITCNVRIIAATNQNLDQMVADRTFRQDLYYRLQVTTIELPPLRDREVDVVLLAHYFVRRFNPQMNTQIRRFSPHAVAALLRYAWPGNVRELENVVQASLVVARGTVFQLEYLPEKIREAAGGAGALSPLKPASDAANRHSDEASLRAMCKRLLAHGQLHGRAFRHVVDTTERELIRAALEKTRGQLAPAARLLGITRTTLRKKMASLGIQVSRSVDDRTQNGRYGQ